MRLRLMSDIVPSATFRFRALEFDPQTRVVQVPGRKTVLDARSSRVFEALSGRFGDCVTKDALMRAGWPAQLVHENSLAKAVSKLRRAIDGSGVEIAAAYGVGYILRDSGSSVATQSAPREIQPATRKSRSRRLTILVTSIAAVLVAAVTGTFAVDRLGQAAVPIRRTPPITNDPPDAVATILWVDDHPSNNANEVEELRRRRVAVHLTESTGDALKLLGINHYRLVVSDLGRGEDRLAGLKMIAAMKQRGMTVPVIIYTIRPSDRSGQETLRRLVAGAGARGLALSPEEVRASISRQLAPTV
jgi:DNA-binding response OmpR family regulator